MEAQKGNMSRQLAEIEKRLVAAEESEIRRSAELRKTADDLDTRTQENDILQRR